jgi:hypothetical protein
MIGNLIEREAENGNAVVVSEGTEQQVHELLLDRVEGVVQENERVQRAHTVRERV